MSSPPVEKVADAVLYEGYLLYPYRSSAVKNRQRWKFGIVYPQAYSEAQGGPEPSKWRPSAWPWATLRRVGGESALPAAGGARRRLRCPAPLSELPEAGEPPFVPAAVNRDRRAAATNRGRRRRSARWSCPPLRFGELSGPNRAPPFVFPATRTMEPVRDAAGMVAGLIVRTQEALECSD